jgi:hypothetical protein
MKLLLAFLCAANAQTNTHTATITITGTINVPWQLDASASNLNSLGGAEGADGNAAKRTTYQNELCAALLRTTQFASSKFGASPCTAAISQATGATTPAVLDNDGSKVVFTLTGYKTSKTTAATVVTEVQALWSASTLPLTISPVTSQFTEANLSTINSPTLTKATTWAESQTPVKVTATTTATTTTKKSGAVEVCASISMIILGFMNVL